MRQGQVTLPEDDYNQNQQLYSIYNNKFLICNTCNTLGKKAHLNANNIVNVIIVHIICSNIYVLIMYINIENFINKLFNFIQFFNFNIILNYIGHLVS